tara:strand:+ start:4879 stop:5772 length:894 start_codon:yes stop_codon:yes gene_type:complete
MKSPVTFCISTFNNFTYLVKAIESVRKYSYYSSAPFIIHAENCSDGTNEWLEANQDKYNLEVYIEQNDTPRGIGGGMNFMVSKVETEYFKTLHSDMFVTKDWDLELLKVFDNPEWNDKPLVVSSLQVQPNIFKEGSRPGTVIVPTDEFGEYCWNFDEDYFIDWASQLKEMNNEVLPKANGGTYLMRKKDWEHLGGNDDIFAPVSFEDIDMYIRMGLENYNCVHTTKSIIYHFAARGSHFQGQGDDLSKSSNRQVTTESSNYHKFIRKWGRAPENNEWHMPIIFDEWKDKFDGKYRIK